MPKVPPHDLDAELSVLGAILIDPEAIIKVGERLQPESFYMPAHQVIYEGMIELFDNREPIDVVTLTNQLKKMKKLKNAGGSAGVAALANTLSTAANVEHYAKIVQELGIKRSLITLSTHIGELAFDESQEVADLVDEVEQRVFAVSQTKSKRNFVAIKDALTESFQRLDELQRNGGDLRGLPTGYADLDNLLTGLQKSNLIILAARPGMGKTTFALNMAQSMAVAHKKKIGFFSLEMSKEELVDRMLVAQADIESWRLKSGKLDQQDFMKISEAMGVLAETEVFIDDTPGLSIFELRTRARRLMIEHQVDIFMVDYLQLAHGRTQDNRVQEVAEISQGLKNIARELRVPVIALSQLSRAVETRGEKAPQLSDLRESGSIEQDADVVMFLYRKDDDIRESVTLRISKHRNGPLGEVDLYFRGDRTRFYGMEAKRPGLESIGQ